jgi:hypothetical protein
MYKIDFTNIVVERGEGLDFHGKVNMGNSEKDVVCTVTHEFLQDINKGSLDYNDTFNKNRFTIETIAEDNLNLLPRESLESKPIKVYITASDISKYEL